MASGILLQQWNGASWTDVSGSVLDSTMPGMLSSIFCVSAVQC